MKFTLDKNLLEQPAEAVAKVAQPIPALACFPSALRADQLIILKNQEAGNRRSRNTPNSDQPMSREAKRPEAAERPMAYERDCIPLACA